MLKRGLVVVLGVALLALLSAPAAQVTGWHGLDMVEAAQSAISKPCKKAKKVVRKRCRPAAKAGSRACKKARRRAAGACKKVKPVRVSVRDDYFTPMRLTVKRGGVVRWVWSGANLNAHNVTLASGPRGARKGYFSSTATGAINLKFERTFTIPGNYEFYCTLHDLMRMQVRVKRP